jgi:hypothetical protein
MKCILDFNSGGSSVSNSAILAVAIVKLMRERPQLLMIRLCCAILARKGFGSPVAGIVSGKSSTRGETSKDQILDPVSLNSQRYIKSCLGVIVIVRYHAPEHFLLE